MTLKIVLTVLIIALMAGFGYLLTESRILRSITIVLFGILLGMTLVAIWLEPMGGE